MLLLRLVGECRSALPKPVLEGRLVWLEKHFVALTALQAAKMSERT